MGTTRSQLGPQTERYSVPKARKHRSEWWEGMGLSKPERLLRDLARVGLEPQQSLPPLRPRTSLQNTLPGARPAHLGRTSDGKGHPGDRRLCKPVARPASLFSAQRAGTGQLHPTTREVNLAQSTHQSGAAVARGAGVSFLLGVPFSPINQRLQRGALIPEIKPSV